MMQNGRVEAIFDDAEYLLREALRELGEGYLRNSAEKAWGATLRATAALILARTGAAERSDLTSRGLREVGRDDERLRSALQGHCYTRMAVLHGDCFYLGICEPEEETERLIRETDAYIQDARDLST